VNKQDRKDLQRAIDMATEAMEEIRRIGEAEREKFDNMSEGLQQSERGEAIEAAADALEQVADDIENALDSAGEFAGGEN
jgi:hypothetical protein